MREGGVGTVVFVAIFFVLGVARADIIPPFLEDICNSAPAPEETVWFNADVLDAVDGPPAQLLGAPRRKHEVRIEEDDSAE